tara:strand:+ start:5211 stop:6125 length:915 start_codon:yes stop_codon:yes gene_type:complete
MIKPKFLNRQTDEPDTDYIAEANEQIRKNGTIDIESPTYKNAIDQFNNGLIRGSLQRLDVPEGFCGYIDPDSGNFIVEVDIGNDLVDIDINNLKELSPTPYPIDACLKNGLPGSYIYTKKACGEDDGDNSCSGIIWFSGEGGGEGTGNGTQENEGVKISQDVCGGGDGINSNTGLAASSPVGGIAGGGSYPPEVWEYADTLAKEVSDSVGYTFYTVSNMISNIVVYDFFYNINYQGPDEVVVSESGRSGQKSESVTPDATFKKSGLRVSVTWDTTKKEIVEGGDVITKMWEYQVPCGENCPPEQ